MALSRRAQFIAAMTIVGAFCGAVMAHMIYARGAGIIEIVLLAGMLIALRVVAYRAKKR